MHHPCSQTDVSSAVRFHKALKVGRKKDVGMREWDDRTVLEEQE